MTNAAHMKAVPGRKTDVEDAAWIAELLRHGLLKASSIPSPQQRDLQELTRHRSSLTWQAVSDRQRVAKGGLMALRVSIGDWLRGRQAL